MTSLDSILKSRDITLPTKVCLVKAMVFLVVMYGCESWTIKKAECRRIDAFDLWCWRRLLGVPWTARRSNQSIVKEISPECSLEGLMLKLKLQYFSHLCEELTYLKRPWCWERLRAGGEGDNKGWDGWMASPTRWTRVWVDSGSWWWIGRPDVHGVAKSQTWQSNWTEPITITVYFIDQLSQIWPVGALSIGILCPFDIFSSFFEDFLTFGHNDIFQAHLIYFLPRPWDPPFLYGALVPFRR